MNLMSEKRQLEIVAAVKTAADKVSDGDSPTLAIVKAARDISANENELQRMVEAYNTSATLAHMRTSQEKAASFPLADYDAAKLELFPTGDKAKTAAAVKKASPFEIPDLRMEKVACFYGDLGGKYKVIKGEHKDAKGTLVAWDIDDTEEKSLDGKTVITKRTETAKAVLKLGDKEVTFENPEAELRRDYDDNEAAYALAPCKDSSEKVADLSYFYGNPGEKYKVVAGEHKGSKGTLKSCKTTHKETNKLEGDTRTTSRTNTAELVLTIGGEDITLSGNDVERDYALDKEAAEKTASAREDELKDYLAWGMRHGARFPTGLVTPEVIAADTQYQSYKKAQSSKTAGAKEAEAVPRDEISLQNHALRQCEHWKKVANEHRRVHEEHRGIALNAMHKLAEVFRRAERPDWTRFEGEVLAVHGKEAKAYLDSIWDTGRLGSVRCVRAEGPVKVAYVDDRTELHKLFEVFKVSAEIAAETKALEDEARTRYEDDRQAVLSHMKSATAIMMPMNNPLLLAANLAGAFDNTIAPHAAGSKANLNPNVGLESELNKARLQAAVKEMMSEDDVISQHASEDPARVVKIVEQLSKVHPKILDMPSVLQSGVRKALELGTIEPFELKQLQSLGSPDTPAPQSQA